MQLNLNELRHLENAIPSSLTLPTNFQLPSLSEFIPCKAEHVHYKTDFAALGIELLAAGIINPEVVSDDATTAKQVVEQGLRVWFMQRIGRLQHLRFDVSVVDAEHANAYVSEGHWNESVSFDGASLAITGDIAEMRFVEDIAHEVEAKVPELFLTAFSELVEASYKTIEVQNPQRILETEASYSLWGNDISSVTDEEAKEELLERYGEEESVDHYMPDAMLRAYGNGFCFNITRPGKPLAKRRKFSDLQLKKLAKAEDSMIANIASKLLNLRKASRRVMELNAAFKSCDENGARPLYVGCILLFSGDDCETQFMDDEHQHLMENGEGTDVYAIEQLPATAAELRTRFQQFDALFDLVTQMDALIPTISYAPGAE